MSFFDNNDPFEDIVNEFFGRRNKVQEGHKDEVISGEEEDRSVDFVESDKKVYLIFEIPGYNEKDVIVAVNKKELQIVAKKLETGKSQVYLIPKLEKGISINKKLPDFINSKKFDHSVRNGVLEVTFEKK